MPPGAEVSESGPGVTVLSVIESSQPEEKDEPPVLQSAVRVDFEAGLEDEPATQMRRCVDRQDPAAPCRHRLR